MPETVMIVAGEASGELYGALLAARLKEMRKGIRITGIGGERMQREGVELLAGIAGAFGLSEAVRAIRSLKQTFRLAVEAFGRSRPDVLVLIDYPDFNLKLAAEARRRRIPVLYYVSPQVWAWRRKRIWKISRLVDRMALVLPFEQDIYRETGLAAEFVGHPVLDEIRQMKTDKASAKADLGVGPDSTLIALLPGSRPHELDHLLPVMIETVSACRDRFPDARFALPFAPNTDIERYGAAVRRLQDQGVLVSKGRSLDVFNAADRAVVASGTATLQAALLGVPLVVVYRVNPITYWLGRMIVKVPHISLVNLLAGGEVVRELMQSSANATGIVAELARIEGDREYRDRMLTAFSRIKAMFSGKKASSRVAEMAAELAGWQA
ncbi:MAG: lipid-A-disaccharide synthase [Thermodesulfovibrionales bacterium]